MMFERQVGSYKNKQDVYAENICFECKIQKYKLYI